MAVPHDGLRVAVRRPGTVPWWINRLIADSEPRRLAVAPAGLKCVLTRDAEDQLENHEYLVLYGGCEGVYRRD